jgi:hypothetical protein
MKISHVFLEVHVPPINVKMVHHLKFKEGEKVPGNQIVRQSEESFRNSRFY